MESHVTISKSASILVIIMSRYIFTTSPYCRRVSPRQPRPAPHRGLKPQNTGMVHHANALHQCLGTSCTVTNSYNTTITHLNLSNSNTTYYIYYSSLRLTMSEDQSNPPFSSLRRLVVEDDGRPPASSVAPPSDSSLAPQTPRFTFRRCQY